MTAFNKIITAEQEAGQLIADSKSETATLITKIQSEAEARIVAENLKLEKSAQIALDACEEKVSGVVKEIEADSATKVSIIEKKFITKNKDLKDLILQSFE